MFDQGGRSPRPARTRRRPFNRTGGLGEALGETRHSRSLHQDAVWRTRQVCRAFPVFRGDRPLSSRPSVAARRRTIAAVRALRRSDLRSPAGEALAALRFSKNTPAIDLTRRLPVTLQGRPARTQAAIERSSPGSVQYGGISDPGAGGTPCCKRVGHRGLSLIALQAQHGPSPRRESPQDAQRTCEVIDGCNRAEEFAAPRLSPTGRFPSSTAAERKPP